MKVYTYSQARQKLASLLDEARASGEVRIRRRDGQVFSVQPVAMQASPLDVEPVRLGWSRDEIVEIVRAGREGDR